MDGHRLHLRNSTQSTILGMALNSVAGHVSEDTDSRLDAGVHYPRKEARRLTTEEISATLSLRRLSSKSLYSMQNLVTELSTLKQRLGEIRKKGILGAKRMVGQRLWTGALCEHWALLRSASCQRN